MHWLVSELLPTCLVLSAILIGLVLRAAGAGLKKRDVNFLCQTQDTVETSTDATDVQ